MTQVVHQVIVQATSLCNLNCSYCYVPNRRDNFTMSTATLENSISKVLASPLASTKVEFLWHAGEPLAAGIRHFEKAMEFIAAHNTRGLAVETAVQTNGTLIDERWCDFFVKHGMGVGISIDGPKALHDINRVNWSEKGSHDAAMRGYRKLVASGIRVGALCVLTRDSLQHPDEIFDFFVDNGFTGVGFNVEEIENSNATSSLSADQLRGEEVISEYRIFMERIFDRWQEDPTVIEIREVSHLLTVIEEKLSDQNYRRIPDETQRLAIITIHKNGDISTFSPEFAGSQSEEFDNFVIANINSDGTLESLLSGPRLERISEEVRQGILACARECLYFDLCGAAYTSNKFFENGSLRSTETTACRLHSQTLSEVILSKLAAAT
ncbi:cyclophane-forming radical SAM/SPASM peptide maturase GrrM/OscB [Streptomyces sp. CA-252508]|uniref:cyclophane-forming radical SAM/SPASM peptide maturase GrrM/OscB n=1 Tax=Streptomyces sp. CA-252508 TaxID=3418946 RepID=UPI003D8B839B